MTDKRLAEIREQVTGYSRHEGLTWFQKLLLSYGSELLAEVDRLRAPLTLAQAVEVLNRAEHNARQWRITTEGIVEDEYAVEGFYEFEAIAIAEKYERDRQ